MFEYDLEFVITAFHLCSVVIRQHPLMGCNLILKLHRQIARYVTSPPIPHILNNNNNLIILIKFPLMINIVHKLNVPLRQVNEDVLQQHQEERQYQG